MDDDNAEVGYYGIQVSLTWRLLFRRRVIHACFSNVQDGAEIFVKDA